MSRFRDCFKCFLLNTDLKCFSYNSRSFYRSFSQPNLKIQPSRLLHFSNKTLSKLFVDVENAHAYTFLPKIDKFAISWNSPDSIKTIKDFENFLNQNWRSSNISAIVEAFEKVKDITISNNINLADHRFDKLVDGLMDHCEKLTDEELLKLLSTLLDYPPCPSSESHNFHDVWSCLDDICCWKMSQWNLSKIFTFADIWYRWNLGRLSDFIYEALDRITLKPQRLSKNMLIYAFFFLNVSRRKTVPFEFEHTISQRINEFSSDELAIIAMGFFKSQTKIKKIEIIQKMISCVTENCKTMNEISIAALLKAIRFSQKIDTVEQTLSMLDQLVQVIPKLSHMALIHVALAGTTLQIKHEDSIIKCAERILTDMENARLKDIERTLLVCSMFNLDTKPSFFDKAFTEIHKESRKEECIKYNRALISCLNYFSLRKKYSFDLSNQVLDKNYIDENFGKSAKNVPRDLFSLDICLEIECPEYRGNRLIPEKRYKAVKWLTEFSPTESYKKSLSLAEKSFMEVVELMEKVLGSRDLLRCDHVLPHFSRADIVICKDKSTNKFIQPFGFENYILGDVKKPFDLDKYKWFVVVVLTPSLIIRDTCLPLGSMIMKERQLKTIGYQPIFICLPDFAKFSESQRLNSIKTKLH